MGNPYTPQSSSGYNASPPPDDGTNSAANEITWSGIKTKLADVLKTFIEAVDTNITSAFAKIFGAGVTATGTNYTVLASDQGKLIRATAAITITTPAAGTEGAPFIFAVKNDHSAAITVDGNGAETIDGAANISLPAGSTVSIMTDGTNWFTVNPATPVVGVDDGEILSATQNWTALASATTVNIGAASSYRVNITGTTTITAFDTVAAGLSREARFDGALTLTHNATSLILPGGANITTASGDIAKFVSEGSGNWRCVKYMKVDGTAVVANQTLSDISTLETATATTSGTEHDYTGIASTARRITVMFNDVSLSGTDDLLVQIGDSGGFETTGYESGSAGTNSTTGFVFRLSAAAQGASGSMILTLMDSSNNTWVEQHGHTNITNNGLSGGGAKSLSATLDRVRITRTGTDTFDAGSVNILIE